MHYKEICELIIKIEKKVDVNAIKWNGIRIWPIIRFVIWLVLTQPEIANGKSPHNGNSDTRSTDNRKNINIFQRLSSLFIRIFQFILLRINNIYSIFKNYVITKFIGKKDILFVSNALHYSEIVEGKRYNRIIDPVFEEFSKEFSCLKITFDRYIEKKRYRSYHFKSPLRKIHFSDQAYSGLENFLIHISNIDSRIHIDIQVTIIQLLKKLVRYKELSEKILRRFHPRVIVSSVYYDMRNMGMIWAANESNIPIIELQHGKQGKYQAMYSHWTKIPQEGYKTLPTWFWNWGEPSADHIMKWQPERSTHRCMVAGFPWMRKWELLNKTNFLRKEINRKYIVLITLQEILDVLPDFIIRAIKESSDEYYWIIRPHYNSKNSKRVAVDKLVDTDKKKYSIDIGENTQLYELLSISNIHMTAFSSVCFEATGFNVPTIIWSKEGKRLYPEEILNHMFFYANNYKALLKNMERAIEMKNVINHGYINNEGIALTELLKTVVA